MLARFVRFSASTTLVFTVLSHLLLDYNGKDYFLRKEEKFARISRKDQAAAPLSITRIGISIYLLWRFYRCIYFYGARRHVGCRANRKHYLFWNGYCQAQSPGINDQSCNVFGVYSGTDRGNDDCVEGKVEV